MELKKNLALSDSGFLFNPANGDSFSLNPIALEIIQAIKQGSEETAILQQLKQNYAVDANTLEKDLYDFLNLLRKHRLLHEN
ncbi:MAG: HPr-rel-A system PqqD family peptide chaperone [Bacteroidia bacterium]